MNARLILTLCILYNAPILNAQETFLDPTFGNKGRMNFSFSPNDNAQFAKNGLLFIDGRIVVCGNVLNSIDITKTMGGIAVIKSSGRLDSNTLINGKLPFDLNVRPVENVSPQVMRMNSTGSIFMSMTQGKTPFSNSLFLKQVAATFSLSPTVGTTGLASVPIFSQTDNDSILIFNNNMEIQSDDKMLISYRKQSQPKVSAAQILVRFNANGSVDKAFGTNGQVIIDSGALNKQLTSSGIINNIDLSLMKQNILVVGDTVIVTNSGNTSLLKMIRYNTNGIVDNSFGNSGVVKLTTIPFSFRSSIVDNNDNIYVLGVSTADLIVIKFKTNGLIDSTFGNKGIFLQTNSPINTTQIILNQQQDLIIIGFNAARQIQLLALKANGTLHASIGSNGSIIVPLNNYQNTPADILPLSNGSLLIISRMKFTETKDDSNVEIIKLKGSSVTPIDNVSIIPEFDIYPNPAHQFFTIKSTITDINQLEIIDLSGKTIFKSKVSNTRIELPGLPTGVYLIKGYDRQHRWSARSKVVIE